MKLSDFIEKKCLELFNFGKLIAKKCDLILVDTKYEFGKDENNNIILIDEIHTCDSSRYWKLNSYKERYINNLEPEKLDKDMIRDYIINKCNPYTDKIPKIPDKLINETINLYKNFYEKISLV